MLVQFSIWPVDQPHMHEDVARSRDILKQKGLNFELGPMGTTVEGSWSDVMEAIRECHEAARASHQRVLTTITVDDHKDQPQSIRQAVESVDQATA